MNNQFKLLIEAKKQKILEEIRQAMENVKVYNFPVFIENSMSKPELIGSCVFLIIDGRKFFVTAGHVANECANSSIFVGYNSKLVEFSGVIIKTAGTNTDKIDIAILELDGGLFGEIEDSDCVTLEMIAPIGTFSQQRIYSFIGYPATKSKIDRSKIDTVKSIMYMYFNTTCEGEVYEDMSLTPETHILVKFDAKKCKNESGEIVTFPKPNGLSGGGVWLHKDLTATGEETTEYLAGIAIEHHADKKCMLGVSIEAVIEVLKQEFNVSSLSCNNTHFSIDD
ncbi:hypothetical protein [Serratia marcescens]|uniref:hypothetical protein n=2 Tax=Serratia marcescens TaxID=615 RepID=UPI001571AC44|nr:hypothetical protein [Serratia marcescens]NSM13561.1 hypothetical protein [Serratia marcescens]NSM97223.1 hypothetical protein [Serratia marcescens]CAF2602859.1 hypothetical protein AI2872V1_3563 [Serratia marcescens]CAF2688816.1 hypothetical protein AI2884V1_3563 [Serratia marcescens]CAH5375218.1 hypothetical protein AI2872V1_3563 [Serratia marcescens]